jgi:hypothetical protein
MMGFVLGNLTGRKNKNLETIDSYTQKQIAGDFLLS